MKNGYKIAIFFFLMNVIYIYQLLNGGNKIFGDLGDARFNLYILEHIYLYVVQEVNSIDLNIFFPANHTLYLSDNNFLVALFYVPFRLVGVDKYTSFQLWSAVALLINFFSFYYVGKRLKFSWVSIVVGAFLFTYSLPVIQQFNHPQLISRFFIPPAFLFLHLFLTKKQLTPLCWCVLMLCLQLIVNIYTGLFLVFLLAIYGVINFSKLIDAFKKVGFDIISQPKQVRILLLPITGLISLIALYYPYLVMAKTTGYRSWESVLGLMPTPQSYFYTNPSSINWKFFNQIFKPTNWEMVAFPGGVVILFFIGLFFLVRGTDFYRHHLLKSVLVTLLLSILFTIKIENYSLYYLVYKIPGFGALRAVSRIISVQMFLFSIVVMIVVHHLYSLVKENKPKYQSVFIGLILVLVFIDQRVTGITGFNKAKTHEIEQEWLDKVGIQLADCQAVVLSIKDTGEPFWMTHLDAMMLTQELRLPCINGYSGGTPTGYALSKPTITLSEMERWLNLNYEKGIIEEKDLKVGIINGVGQRPYENLEISYLNFEDITYEKVIDEIYLYLLDRKAFPQELAEGRELTRAKLIYEIVNNNEEYFEKTIEHKDTTVMLNRIYKLFVDKIPKKNVQQKHVNLLKRDGNIINVVNDIILNYNKLYNNQYLLTDISPNL